jgi:ComF family protein
MVLDLLYPRRCPICDRPVQPFGSLVCESCGEQMSEKRLTERDILCCQCGKVMRESRQELCRDCREGLHVYRRGCAAYRYRDISGAIYRLKYEGRAEYAEWMGEEMTRRLLQEFALEEIDAFVPVPVSRQRMRKRGYNQASLLAQAMSRRVGIPVQEEWLVRRTDTAAMRSMGADERRNNLKKAFTAPSDDVESKVIMLVDDIYTTGSTVDACAAALLGAGAAEVNFISLAIGEDQT